MSGFELDTDVLPDVAGRLDATASTLRQHTEAVRATVDGTGNPWGDDQQGSLFGQLYAGVLNHVVDVMDNHVEQLGYASEALRQWQTNHLGSDERSADRFTSLRGEL